MKITTIGIDLAKNVFQVHGVDAQGKTVLRKQIKHDEMMVFFANLSPCLIGMEACGGAHCWARKLEDQGHTVKLMAPQFVKLKRIVGNVQVNGSCNRIGLLVHPGRAP